MCAENNMEKREDNSTETDQIKQEISGDTSERYMFTLLREEAVNIDAFEDKTHEKIAETLYQLIKKEKGGVTVGLEGTWGSGKSAVISILRKKLEKEKEIISFFSFDAWAHEGDPLRRIFLESLIEKLFTDKNEAIINLQNKIAKRFKTSTITSTRSATGLGKFLALTTLFVTIGVSLLSKVNFDNLTIKLGEKPYVLFLISIFFLLAPFEVLLVRLLHLIIKCKVSFNKIHPQNFSMRLYLNNIFTSRNWAFMQGESTENITQEVSEENERSSIEFENYFKKIMTALLVKEPKKRLVLVIDNLDRVDPDDSLKIWSTLQTFLQQRNTPINTQNWFERIWIIVPYDPDGLAELWNKSKVVKEVKGKQEDKETENVEGKAQFFFDKCFQIKIEVPKPILTTWERFAKEKINEAFSQWEKTEQDTVLEILKSTRENLNDIPTPRQIKNYINQVGLTRMHCNQMIPTTSISYYVILRLLKRQSVDDIRARLISGSLPDQRSKQFLPDSCSQDLAGLVFGVSPKKGQTLLLEPDIARYLISGNGEKLRGLYEKHLDGFWAVFFHHIQKRPYGFEDLLNCSKAIYIGLWKDFNKRLIVFSRKARDITLNNEKFEWPNENTIDYYQYLAEILNSQDTCKFLYEKLLQSLDSQIESHDEFDISATHNVYQNFINIFNVLQKLIKTLNIYKKYNLSSLHLNKFIAWAQVSFKSDIPVWQWIVPDIPLVSEISRRIVQGVAIPPGVKDSIYYLIKAETSDDWQELIVTCQNHISHNNGNMSGDSHSPEVFEILFILAFNFDKYNENIKRIVKDWKFYNLAWHFREKFMPTIALLCGKYVSNELNQFSPNQANAPTFTAELRTFWKNRKIDNAKTLFELLKNFNKWHFLWDLAEDPNNKLVVDLILLALNEEKATSLFEVEDGLKKFKSYLNLLGDNETNSIETFVKKLMKHSSLETEIIENNELNIIEYEDELFYVVKYSSSFGLIKHLADKLKEQSKEKWSEALKDDTYLTSLAITIKEKLNKFGLENDYADAFFDFVKINSDNIDGINDWQKDNWHELVSLATTEFQERFKYDWTKFLIDKHNTICDEILHLNEPYCDYETIEKNIKTIQDILRDSIHNNNFNRLNWLNDSVLSSDKVKKFKPEQYFPKTIKTPLNDLIKIQEEKGNVKNVDLLKELASKFHVEIEKSDSSGKQNNDLIK